MPTSTSTSTDRYKKFARDWKSIRMVSKMKWPWRAKEEEVNTLITSMMLDRFGDKALDVIADAYYQIGLKDGDKIITKLRITGKDSTACLSVIEALSVLAGVNSEFKDKDKEGGSATLCLMNCPFTDTLRFFHPLVCAKYTQGLVEGVNEKAKVKLVKGLCGGDDYCEFEITIG